MQEAIDQVSQACDSYYYHVSITKIDIVYQSAPGKPYNESSITANGQRLQAVDKSTLLEALCEEQCTLMLNARVAEGTVAIDSLHGNVSGRSGSRLDTKLKVWKAVVLQPSYMHASQQI